MAGMSQGYPLWKYILLIVMILAGLVYAAPNLYPAYPAIQISNQKQVEFDQATVDKIKAALASAHIDYIAAHSDGSTAMLRFSSTDVQLKAKEVIQALLGDNYSVALNLDHTTPAWLQALGARPMKLGLDLQGGVHFLLQVDIDSVMQQRIEADMSGLGKSLREQKIRYTDITRKPNHIVQISFANAAAQSDALDYLNRSFGEMVWDKVEGGSNFQIEGKFAPQALFKAKQETLEQAMNTLRNRVNELGISEAIVQQQGDTRVSVDLPGIQDTADAKNILGKTATLEFHLVDEEHDANAVAQGEVAPAGARLYYDHDRPILLQNDIILKGSSIISATSGFDQDGRASVSVRLKGGGDALFTKTTADNIGKLMAVVFVEVKSTPSIVDGKETIQYQTLRKIISVAQIKDMLSNNFQISGLMSQNESRNLALLLRAGALPAPVTIIEERQVGPSLGQQNIHMGLMSITVGMGLVVIFMMFYYRLMGVIADLALGLNLILIVAILSLLGATLTLPGIAGLILTVAMAADANVLIFERIREELRRGMSPSASIYAGYERAFTTILDANVTTLIVMMILFSLGSGMIKGIAITVTIGLLTSMFTAITGTRAVVELLYRGQKSKNLSIGI